MREAFIKISQLSRACRSFQLEMGCSRLTPAILRTLLWMTMVVLCILCRKWTFVSIYTSDIFAFNSMRCSLRSLAMQSIFLFELFNLMLYGIIQRARESRSDNVDEFVLLIAYNLPHIINSTTATTTATYTQKNHDSPKQQNSERTSTRERNGEYVNKFLQ